LTALRRPCRLFLFDLDGTLINSRSDIAGSLNLALARLGLLSLSESQVTDFVGDGIQKLVERALRETTGRDPAAMLIQEGIRLFREEYTNHLLDKTCLYPHVTEALDSLSWAKFAVVSNKPQSLSQRILEGLEIANRFSIILGGDSIQNRKPDPESLLKAMKFCGALPSETAMVGDSAVDIEAGKAAGVTTCGLLGGYRSEKELRAAGCDLMLNNLQELARHFYDPKKNPESRIQNSE
jgi:phosphoglycolate phosphatase